MGTDDNNRYETLREAIANALDGDSDDMVSVIINAFETHFALGDIQLSTYVDPKVVIKSDNSTRNSIVKFGDVVLSVKAIYWTLDAEYPLGELKLTFV